MTLVGLAFEVANFLRASSPDGLSRLRFDVPATEPDPTQLDGLPSTGLPLGRVCCDLQAVAAPVVGDDLGIEDIQHGHIYDYPGKYPYPDPCGHLYTQRGGILDIGHVRDGIDNVRYLTSMIYLAPPEGVIKELSSTEAHLRVRIKPRAQPLSIIDAALCAAKIAYEMATWYELATWFTSQKFSSFSPEDNFSNALGSLVGYRAMMKPNIPFGVAVDSELSNAVFALMPAPKQIMANVRDYLEDYWFGFSELALVGLRRHLDALSPVKPWLATDVARPDKKIEGKALREAFQRPKAAKLFMPRFTVANNPLEDIAEFEIQRSSDNDTVEHLLPGPDSLVFGPNDFAGMIEVIRPLVNAEYPHGDQPGPTDWP